MFERLSSRKSSPQKHCDEIGAKVVIQIDLDLRSVFAVPTGESLREAHMTQISDVPMSSSLPTTLRSTEIRLRNN